MVVRRTKKNPEQINSFRKLAALGSLTAGVAHEINTPLGNSITMISYLENTSKITSEKFANGNLTKKDLEITFEKNHESYILIMKSLNTIVSLIERFKLLTSAKPSQNLNNVELRPFIEDLLNHKKNAQNKVITIDYKIDDISIFCNSDIIAIVLENLFENSIVHGFMNDNFGTIYVKAYKDTLNKTIVIEYCDNGVGISKENRDNIFTPFYSTKKNKNHVGLGLHIVFNAVTNTLDGNIELIKNDQDMDVFRLSFPERKL